jgi:hypothetical protein
MEKEKIYELRIEENDDISGIDSISLVEDPAIEINWLAFNKQKEYFNIPDGEDNKYLFMLEQFGQDEDELIQQGYTPFRVGNFEVQNFFETYPNAESEWNTDEYLVRYKYMLNPEVQNNRNPIIPTTRDFCSNLIKKNFVFRIEDMDRLTNDQGTSALVWRGGWNCRHSWSKILYKKDTKIVNKASVNKGKVLDAGGVFPTDLTPDLAVLGYGQPNTRTRYPSFSKEKMSYPLFEDKESAEMYGEKVLGCQGSHEHKIGDKIMYMPCDKHPFSRENMESVSDYPDSVKNNAKNVLDWVDKNGWGSCGTDVGKQRANQLAKGEPISMETVQRMYSYLSRHEKDLESSKSYSDGCGKLMYDAWGGKSALSWSKSKLEQFGYDVSTLPSYVDQVTGKTSTSMSKQSFQIENEDKRIVIGPAMVPDLKIIRTDKKGNPYYVFFTEETIRMIAEKYIKNKYIDNNDINHDGKAVKDVYVTESWIIEDEQYDKSKKYGFDLPVGTWMVSMKVNDNEVWDKVKKGDLKGFSVSGFFEEYEVEQFNRKKEELFLKELAQLLKNIE